jgi:hypothetical protein
MVKLSGKWLAVSKDDPVVAEPEGEPSNSREESEAALAAWAKSEGEDFFGDWEVAQLTEAALDELGENGGSIEEMMLHEGVIYASSESEELE